MDIPKLIEAGAPHSSKIVGALAHPALAGKVGYYLAAGRNEFQAAAAITPPLQDAPPEIRLADAHHIIYLTAGTRAPASVSWMMHKGVEPVTEGRTPAEVWIGSFGDPLPACHLLAGLAKHFGASAKHLSESELLRQQAKRFDTMMSRVEQSEITWFNSQKESWQDVVAREEGKSDEDK